VRFDRLLAGAIEQRLTISSLLDCRPTRQHSRLTLLRSSANRFELQRYLDILRPSQATLHHDQVVNSENLAAPGSDIELDRRQREIGSDWADIPQDIETAMSVSSNSSRNVINRSIGSSSTRRPGRVASRVTVP
jgi:hypothetical protein